MTDLISKLADDLLALNNASPRLPRKEQIEEVLRAASQPPALGSGRTYYVTTIHQAIDAICGGIDSSALLATQEQLVKAADDICAATTDNHMQWRPIEGTRSAECVCGCGAMKYYP